MKPSTMRKVISGVVASTPQCCPDMYPHLAEITKNSNVSRSTTYRYLIQAIGLGYVETTVIMRGTKETTAYIVTGKGNEFLASWLELPFASYAGELEYREALQW